MSMNMMKVGDYNAVVRYDPEIEMFRGEFLGLNGGADFYAADVEGLKNEADISLKVFLETCEEKGIEPVKNYSGKFNVRIDPKVHRTLAILSESEETSLNTLVADSISWTLNAAMAAKVSLADIGQLLEYVADDGIDKYFAVHKSVALKRRATAKKKVSAKKKAAVRDAA
jgi:predicted HicB family RNase H-like nuclease